jgi:hypothetical protein
MGKQNKTKVNDKDDVKNKLEKKLDNLKLDPSLEHLYIDNELITSQKTFKAIKELIKQEYEKPSDNIHGFLISMKINKNSKTPLIINCSQITITPKLFVGPQEDDAFQSFTYNINELIKYGFKLVHIKKMMRAIKKNTVSFEKDSISISELLEL